MKQHVKVKQAIVLPNVERRNLAIAILVLLVMVGGVFYYFAYPRISFEVETWYSEGFLGGVNIDVTVRNNAPTTLERCTLTITLMNMSMDTISSTSRSNFTIKNWETFSIPSLSISGVEMGNNTHFDTFMIIVEFSFTSQGQNTHRFQYETEGEYMNLFFSERIGRFPF